MRALGVETQPEQTVADFPLTDAGNAERFAARNQDEVRFVHGPDRWLVWDGARWAFDDMREVRRRAKDSARSILLEAQVAGSEDHAKRLAKHALQSERRQAIEAALTLASSEPPLAILADQLDASSDLVNVENGTINLVTGALEPHLPENLITKLAPVAYDPDAMAPAWQAFLARVLPDSDVRDYVQRAVGYSLTGNVSEHALFFCYGTGANGKSTFLEVMLELLGDYAKSAPHNLLLAAKHDRHAAEIATLMGFRFVTAVEAGEGRSWDEAKVKWLTGGDTISARWMYGNPFTFRPAHKFWIAANHKPRVRGTDLGFWRRVHLVPFTVTIPEEDQDKELGTKLRREIPGILRWALEGCLAWRREGLSPPPAVLEATRAYRAGEDVVGAFLEEHCVLCRDGRVLRTALFSTFQQWSERNGEQSMTNRAFGVALEEREIEIRKTNGKYWVMGLSLKTREDERDAA